MKRREKFEARGVLVESSIDWNGRYYLAWRPSSSLYFRDRKELVKWLGYPQTTPTRALLLEWLDELDAKDAAKKGPVVEPVAHTEVVGSFDPNAHQDEDPVLSTKMVL
jgi:hypothetical protein